MTDTAELQRRVDGWRQWVRLIFTELSAEDIAAMTDRDLQRVIAQSADENRERAIRKIVNENGTSPQGQNH